MRTKLLADPHISRAISALASARDAFESAVDAGLISGNDNHIGDVGEYWVKTYFESQQTFQCLAPTRNAPYDLKLIDGTLVSVKTITAWSKNGYGTQVKPLCGNNWQLLAAVLLDKSLHPEKIALVPLSELLNRKIFIDNAVRRGERGTHTFPRFQWWPWLADHVVYSHA